MGGLTGATLELAGMNSGEDRIRKGVILGFVDWCAWVIIAMMLVLFSVWQDGRQHIRTTSKRFQYEFVNA